MKLEARRHSGQFVCVLGLFLAASLVLGGLEGLAAEKYPSKPVTIIVPWSVGGRTDLMTRIIAPALEKQLKQPFVVVNKPGGAGTVGTKSVADSPADGYTIGMISNTTVLTQYTVLSPLDLGEYEFIAMVKFDPATLTLCAERPYKTVKDFVNYGKQNPGNLRNATSGSGASDHIFAVAFEKAAGIKIQHIAHKGDGPAVIAVAGGHLDCNFAPMVAVKPLVDAGKLKIVGVASEKRMVLAPDIPTWKEQGINLSIGSWEGMAVPKNTPKEIVVVLEKAIQAAMQDPETIDRLTKAYLNIYYMNHEDFNKFIPDQDRILKALIEELGLRIAPKK